MSNLLLRSLRQAGYITSWALPFARANAATDLVERLNVRTPDSPRTVMILDDARNSGEYWVVSEEDAQRLEAKGYTRYVTKLIQPEKDEG